MRKIIFLLSVLLLCGIIFLGLKQDKLVISIDGKEISTIVVSDDATREQGLGGMESLPENTVMLFIFDSPDKYGIWMKDMRFSIDIVWLDEAGKIVWLENNVSPDTYPKVFFPPEKSLYTIEAKPGFIEQNQLVVGKVLSVVEK
jgi:uncharacterized membrane protein (UPF0127 family)